MPDNNHNDDIQKDQQHDIHHFKDLAKLIEKGVALDRAVEDLARAICVILDTMDPNVTEEKEKKRNRELMDTMVTAIEQAIITIVNKYNALQ